MAGSETMRALGPDAAQSCDQHAVQAGVEAGSAQDCQISTSAFGAEANGVTQVGLPSS